MCVSHIIEGDWWVMGCPPIKWKFSHNTPLLQYGAVTGKKITAKIPLNVWTIIAVVWMEKIAILG